MCLSICLGYVRGGGGGVWEVLGRWVRAFVCGWEEGLGIGGEEV